MWLLLPLLKRTQLSPEDSWPLAWEWSRTSFSLLFFRCNLWDKSTRIKIQFTAVGQRTSPSFTLLLVEQVQSGTLRVPQFWVEMMLPVIESIQEKKCSSEQIRDGIETLNFCDPAASWSGRLKYCSAVPSLPTGDFPSHSRQRTSLSKPPPKSLLAPAPRLVWANSCWIRPC